MNKILIIIVVYCKNISSLSLVTDLIKSNEQVDIFIYDNSPCAQSIPVIENINFYYEHDEKNSGVSRGYNRGVQKAKELQKEVVLLLDQDTEFILDYIQQYLSCCDKHKDRYIYAPIICDQSMSKIYSPAHMNSFVGKIQVFKNFIFTEKYSLENKSIINSGLMIPLPLFDKIGGFNEKIKLDFSDIYFIEKYKEINLEIILVNVYIKHSISGDEGKEFGRELHRFKYYCNGASQLGKSLSTPIYWSPLRRLIRLIIKYKSLKFISVYYNYFLKGVSI